MKKAASGSSRTLRWRLLQPLALTFALLWFGTMALMTYSTCHQLQGNAGAEARNAFQSLTQLRDDQEAYGSGPQSMGSLQQRLNALTLGGICDMDGGMALLCQTQSGPVRSELTWGWACTGADAGNRWYLSFDEGLDDAGQLELSRWLRRHRQGWDCVISREEEGDSARVTGIEAPGNRIAVQKVEIVHADGTVEVMTQTGVEDTGKVWDFPYLNVRSVLLPSWSSDGRDGPVDPERRLAAFREAQAVLDRALAGEERSVRSSWGFQMTSRADDPSGLQCMLAVQCNPWPAALRQETGLYLSTGLLTLAVLSLLSAWLSRQVTDPVEELCRESEQGICREDGPVRELNVLAAAFNGARRKLSEQLVRERAFTRAAAHELKTPLAILRAHAECAREDIAPEKRAAYLDVVLEESDHMAELVGGLLDLARLESDAPLRTEPLDLAALVREVWESWKLQVEQKGIRLSLMLEEIRLEGNPDLLRRLADNLASNALRHTPRGGAIQVELCRQAAGAVLMVDNDGPAIPEEALPRLWEPFFRVDAARNRTEGGSGLGLAIVQAAVRAHGGSCTAENRSGGVRFQVVLPCGDRDPGSETGR